MGAFNAGTCWSSLIDRFWPKAGRKKRGKNEKTRNYTSTYNGANDRDWKSYQKIQKAKHIEELILIINHLYGEQPANISTVIVDKCIEFLNIINSQRMYLCVC